MPFFWEPENLGGMKFLKKIILAKKKKNVSFEKTKERDSRVYCLGKKI